MDFKRLSPFNRAVIEADLLGHHFRFHTAHGLFSADRIDDGTRLLLDHLPAGSPKSILDMGCGYGALGLPIARRHPDARLLLVDRDVLAATWASRNAQELGLTNVQAQPGLGYREIADGRFDWVLCNVPARIGKEGIGYLMGVGASLLNAGGELRVVVINDLQAPVEELAREQAWPLKKIITGARHTVYALPPLPPAITDHVSLYGRDTVDIRAGSETLSLQRAHDLSEDPSHLKEGIPLLLECLPRNPKGRALVFRGGYGAAAITLARRGAHVLAADRDLLPLAFTALNAERTGVSLDVKPALWLPDAIDLAPDAKLVVGELSSTAGDAVARAECLAAVNNLSRGTEVLWLTLKKHTRPWLDPPSRKSPPAATVLATRGAWSVLRLTSRGS